MAAYIGPDGTEVDAYQLRNGRWCVSFNGRVWVLDKDRFYSGFVQKFPRPVDRELEPIEEKVTA